MTKGISRGLTFFPSKKGNSQVKVSKDLLNKTG
jgi:hypothetical protein